jgi:hypothetical protein
MMTKRSSVLSLAPTADSSAHLKIGERRCDRHAPKGDEMKIRHYIAWLALFLVGMVGSILSGSFSLYLYLRGDIVNAVGWAFVAPISCLVSLATNLRISKG